MSLRLLVYDATPGVHDRLLRRSWATGARLYRSLGWIDRFHGASSWADALSFLGRVEPGESIAEIQYWGHGRWGRVLIGDDTLEIGSLSSRHAHRDAFERLRSRMLPEGRSLVWFRTCETFGAEVGHRFASALVESLDARAAGHTYVIGALQSGLHGLRPGESPRWSTEEGLERGTGAAPLGALSSTRDAPHTLHFMNHSVPEPWFDR